MSKTYRCRVKKDIREVHSVEDEIEYKVSLLDILDQDEMEEEYRKALRSLGADEDSDGNIVLDVDGVEVTVDTSSKKATARVDGKEEIEIHVDKEVKVFDWGDNERRAQEEAEKVTENEMKAEVEDKIKAHEKKVRGKLNAAGDKIKEKLREAANEAHKSALRKKAERIGRVTVDQEDGMENGDQRLTIEIEVNS